MILESHDRNIKSRLYKHHVTMVLKLLIFLDVSLIKLVVIFISNLIKNLLTQIQ